MSVEIAVAVLSLCGTLLGSAGGILTASRMTNFRLQQLEGKVEKHNNLIYRTFMLEEKMKQTGERMDHIEEAMAWEMKSD